MAKRKIRTMRLSGGMKSDGPVSKRPLDYTENLLARSGKKGYLQTRDGLSHLPLVDSAGNPTTLSTSATKGARVLQISDSEDPERRIYAIVRASDGSIRALFEHRDQVGRIRPAGAGEGDYVHDYYDMSVVAHSDLNTTGSDILVSVWEESRDNGSNGSQTGTTIYRLSGFTARPASSTVTEGKLVRVGHTGLALIRWFTNGSQEGPCYVDFYDLTDFINYDADSPDDSNAYANGGTINPRHAALYLGEWKHEPASAGAGDMSTAARLFPCANGQLAVVAYKTPLGLTATGSVSTSSVNRDNWGWVGVVDTTAGTLVNSNLYPTRVTVGGVDYKMHYFPSTGTLRGAPVTSGTSGDGHAIWQAQLANVSTGSTVPHIFKVAPALDYAWDPSTYTTASSWTGSNLKSCTGYTNVTPASPAQTAPGKNYTYQKASAVLHESHNSTLGTNHDKVGLENHASKFVPFQAVTSDDARLYLSDRNGGTNYYMTLISITSHGSSGGATRTAATNLPIVTNDTPIPFIKSELEGSDEVVYLRRDAHNTTFLYFGTPEQNVLNGWRDIGYDRFNVYLHQPSTTPASQTLVDYFNHHMVYNAAQEFASS